MTSNKHIQSTISFFPNHQYKNQIYIPSHLLKDKLINPVKDEDLYITETDDNVYVKSTDAHLYPKKKSIYRCTDYSYDIHDPTDIDKIAMDKYKNNNNMYDNLIKTYLETINNQNVLLRTLREIIEKLNFDVNEMIKIVKTKYKKYNINKTDMSEKIRDFLKENHKLNIKKESIHIDKLKDRKKIITSTCLIKKIWRDNRDLYNNVHIKNLKINITNEIGCEDSIAYKYIIVRILDEIDQSLNVNEYTQYLLKQYPWCVCAEEYLFTKPIIKIFDGINLNWNINNDIYNKIYLLNMYDLTSFTNNGKKNNTEFCHGMAICKSREEIWNIFPSNDEEINFYENKKEVCKIVYDYVRQ